MADQRTLEERMDDAILAQCHALARLRGITIRGAVMDFRATCVENLNRSQDTPDWSIWSRRIDRCDTLLQEPNDNTLRIRAAGAVERDR